MKDEHNTSSQSTIASLRAWIGKVWYIPLFIPLIILLLPLSLVLVIIILVIVLLVLIGYAVWTFFSRAWEHFTRWLTLVRALGLVFLTLAIIGGVLGYRNQHPGGFKLADVILDYYANATSELASIAITILLIDSLYQRKDEVLRHKEKLIEQIRSGDNWLAVEAIKELEKRGWLQSGSLEGELLYASDLADAQLAGANLSGVFLSRANLQRVNLGSAILSGANLQEASMSDAFLRDADLRDANLQRSRLENAILEGANLKNATLNGAILNRTLFRDAKLGGVDFTEAQGLVDTQLMAASELRGATLPSGKRYDGRFNLHGDLRIAMPVGRRDAIDRIDIGFGSGQTIKGTALSSWFSSYYGVSEEEYQKGQEWARDNIELMKQIQGDRFIPLDELALNITDPRSMFVVRTDLSEDES